MIGSHALPGRATPAELSSVRAKLTGNCRRSDFPSSALATLAGGISSFYVTWEGGTHVSTDMQLALDASIAQVPPAEGEASELDDIESLIRKYRPRLLRFVAFSIGDADLAESITQDCFLKAYKTRDRFRNDCSVSTWLTSIAVNLIRDQMRLKKFRFWRQARATAIDIGEAAHFLPSPETSPENLLLVKEKTSQVYTALDHLSPKQRTVFLMRFAQEMELAEISAATNIPVNTVKTHLHRALRSVRAQVGASHHLRQIPLKSSVPGAHATAKPAHASRSTHPFESTSCRANHPQTQLHSQTAGEAS